MWFPSSIRKSDNDAAEVNVYPYNIAVKLPQPVVCWTKNCKVIGMITGEATFAHMLDWVSLKFKDRELTVGCFGYPYFIWGADPGCNGSCNLFMNVACIIWLIKKFRWPLATGSGTWKERKGSEKCYWDISNNWKDHQTERYQKQDSRRAKVSTWGCRWGCWIDIR